MSEVRPSTSHDIVDLLRSILATSSHLLSPAERDRITAEESARAYVLLKIALDTAWQCAHREEVDSITRLEEAKRRAEEIAPVGGEQSQARKLEIIRAEADKVATEMERLKVETLKIKAEADKVATEMERLKVETLKIKAEAERDITQKEKLVVETLKIKAEAERDITQKEKLVVEVERVNAEIVIRQLNLELRSKG